MNTIIDFLWNDGWVIPSLVALGVALTASIIEGWVYHLLYPRLTKTRTYLDHSLLYALHRPLQLLIWSMGLIVASCIVANHFGQTDAEQYLLLAKKVIFIAAIGWAAIRFASRVEKHTLNQTKKTGTDKATVQSLMKLLKIAIFILFALILMQTLGIPITGVLAFGGVSGVAIGFAAKDLLGNFFGGLVIFLDRPFAVGDWISSPDKDISGTVEKIGWRSTNVRTIDSRPLYIPNGIFTTIAIENVTRMSFRRIHKTVGIRYQDSSKLAAIVKDIDAMLHKHADIDENEAIYVNFEEFAASSLNIDVTAYTPKTAKVDYLAVQQDVMIKIMEIVSKHGAECAFPTTTLDIPTPIEIKS